MASQRHQSVEPPTKAAPPPPSPLKADKPAPTPTPASPIAPPPSASATAPLRESVPPSPLPKGPPPADVSREASAVPEPTPEPEVEPEIVDAAAEALEKGDAIDMETFTQILDLDEEDNHEFSRGMVMAYFSQAATTFDEMDSALASKNLPQLSSLGHFLKGSSAALGVAKVQASCEQIQHLGQKRDEQAGKDLSAEDALRLIGTTLARVKKEYVVAEAWLKKWYDDHQDEEPVT